MMRDWLAGVAALTLLGVHPASAQTRSLFDALPEPGRATAFAPVAPSAADVSPAPRKVAALPAPPLPPSRPIGAIAPAMPPQARATRAGAVPQPSPSGASVSGETVAEPAAPTASTVTPDKQPTRAERRKAMKEARLAAASAPTPSQDPSATPSPAFATNPFMTLFGAAPAQERGERLPPVAGRGQIDSLVAHHARLNHVPEALVHRIIVRESRYNPRAVGRGGAMGLMQIKTATARGVGYTGGPSGLLDAETNLTYGVKYLAGAWRVAGGSHDRAVSHYARGYYYEAKRRGLSGRRGRETDAETSAQAASAPASFFSVFERQASAQ